MKNTVSKNIYVLFFSLMCWSCPATAGTAYKNLQELQEIKNKISADDKTIQETADILLLNYDRLFLHIKKEERESETEFQQAMFDAASMLEFYTGSPIFLEKMRFHLDLLQKENSADRSRTARMYHFYISAEDFDGAQKFHDLHPEIAAKPLPKFVDDGNSKPRPEWISNSAGVLKLENFAFPDGPFVLMVMSEKCHFTRNAVKDLSVERDIVQRLNGHAKFITRIDTSFDWNSLQQWNRENVNFQLSLAHRPLEWKEINSWETPSFYFLLNGKVVSEFKGWPKNGNLKKLNEHMKQIGL